MRNGLALSEDWHALESGLLKSYTFQISYLSTISHGELHACMLQLSFSWGPLWAEIRDYRQNISSNCTRATLSLCFRQRNESNLWLWTRQLMLDPLATGLHGYCTHITLMNQIVKQISSIVWPYQLIGRFSDLEGQIILFGLAMRFKECLI